MSALEKLKTFTTENLPDLDEVVTGALELLTDIELPDTSVPFARPLVIGSAGSAAVGHIIFKDNEAIFAEESAYLEALEDHSDIDGVVLISASGGKHAVLIAAELQKKDLPTILFTNNADAPAKQYLDQENVRVFPKNREPYTYNISTYLSMILADTKEDAGEILRSIEREVVPKSLCDFGTYHAFTLILPSQFSKLRPMLRTKFDELFGPKICGRVFTSEEIKHAKTVVPDEKELFISFGVENISYGSKNNRSFVPLPEGGGYGAALATSYYLIGQIQKAHPPYFKEYIVQYCQEASHIFDQKIKPIVE